MSFIQKHPQSTVQSPPFIRSWQELCTDSVICLVKAFILTVGSLRPRFSVDSESVHAGVFWMTPVRQHSHFDYLEGPVVLLLRQKKYSEHNITQTTAFLFSDRLEGPFTITGNVWSDSPSSWYMYSPSSFPSSWYSSSRPCTKNKTKQKCPSSQIS